MNDSQIIALYWERNEDAIRETDQVYGPRLFAISDRLLHSRQDAQESVNDTYLETWNTVPPQRPVYFFAYLAKICRNFSLARIQWNTAAKRNAEVIALTQLLNVFLDSISSENRRIFLRRYWFSDSIQEISDRYHISQSKVKTQLHRTRKKLKDFLEQEGITV